MMIRDRIRKELMSAHKPPVLPPELEEPPMAPDFTPLSCSPVRLFSQRKIA
jgi:hypothetical protein